MAAVIAVRSIRDRWPSTAVGATIVGLVLVGALAAYRTVDTSIYQSLPQAVRATMGIPAGADPSALAFGVAYKFIGAMTLAGLALSLGASSIAGEERDGTIALLLGNPRSRSAVLGAKAAAIVVVILAGASVLLVAGLAGPVVLGIDLGAASVPALVTHLFVNALFYGAVALGVGAWSGNRALAAGATAGLMVGSYFAASILPLVPALAGAAKVSPWYWFDAGDPFTNGLQVGPLALLGAGIVVAAGSAFPGVNRRDLRQGSGTSASLVERLRAHPRAGALADRLGGRGRVSRVAVKAAAESQVLLFVVAYVMFFMMGILLGPMYAAIRGAVSSFAASLPSAMVAFAGGGDITTPEGWYQLETFGLMAPIAVMAVTVLAGSRALAGEEADHTMGLLLANPVSRRRVVCEKAVAMAVHAMVIGAATFAGVTGGSLLAGLGISVANIAATCLLLTLLGVLIGAIALAIGGVTGRTQYAVFGAIGAAGVAYLVNAVGSVADSLSSWKRLSPFDWYVGNDPMTNGLPLASVVEFVVLIACLVVVAAAGFERRDLRG